MRFLCFSDEGSASAMFRLLHRLWPLGPALLSLAASVTAAAEVAPPSGGATNEPPARVRVAEGRAAVFATTNAVREAAAWLPAGTELTVRGELPDESVWVRVEPPEGVSVWIYRELVRDGAVTADKSRVRAGAGLNFRAVGSLSKGDRVEVRGTYGDWLKIKPPEGVAFWMLRDQVEPLATLPAAGAAAADESQPDAAPEGLLACLAAELSGLVASNAPPQTPAAPARALPAELEGAELAAVPDQGGPLVQSGVLDWGTVGGFAAPFCLTVRQPDGDSLPVCHVIAPAALASPHVGERVTLEGSRWIVKGVALPVLVARSLRPAE